MPEKGAFLLCKTSNPGAGDLQDLPINDAPLYVRVAKLAQEWNTGDNIGLVVGATQPEALTNVRAAAPDLWFLSPGVGAQGGDMATALKAGLRKDGNEFFAQVSVACNRDTDGEVVGMVVSLDDISDRKRAEEAVRQSERQRVMLASVGAACHHLGQPATVIMTNLELIRRMTKDIDKPELQNILDLTGEAAENLAEVLHKLNAVNEYRTVQYLDAQDSQSPANIILDI